MSSPKLESDLIELSLPFIPKMVQSDGMQCFMLDREVGVGGSIADIVVLVSSYEPPSSTAVLSTTQAVALSHLRRHGPTRIDLLEQRCRIPRGSLRDRELASLCECGMIQQSSGGRIELSEQGWPNFQIVAIEAKLRRWRDALSQATSYRRYADYSYVLLPDKFSGAAKKNINEFAANGVGLWVLDDTAVLSLLEPEKSIEHCWRREYVFSRMWRLEGQGFDHITHNKRHQRSVAV